MTTRQLRRFSKPSKPSSSGAGRDQRIEPRNGKSSKTSTVSTIRVDGTQHWVGKTQSPSNGKGPKRALGPTQIRDTRPKISRLSLTLG